MFNRRARLVLLIFKELSQKYTKLFLAGFTTGVLISFVFWRLFPVIESFFAPVDRIGIVGEFTPSSLPAQIQTLLSAGLTMLDESGVPRPHLATSWEATESGRVFTFHIGSSYVWHKGNRVEANDINYRIQNVRTTVLDARTLRFELEAPYAPLPVLLSKPIFLSGLRGIGPYSVQKITLKGDRVSYLKLVPVVQSSLHQKEFRFYRTEALAADGFRLGEINILETDSKQSLLTHLPMERVTEEVMYQRVVSLFFNQMLPLFKEKSVRQALAYAVPELPYERATSPISKKSWAYSDRLKRYDYNQSQSKKLLSQVKVDLPSTTLTITTFARYLDVAQLIAASWKGLGINTEVKVENTIPSEYQVLLAALDLPPDPDQYPFWHSTQKQTNITGYVNTRVDKLLEDGRRELDSEKRKAIYAEFQRRLVDDAPAVFLYYPKSFTVKRK